ncbi:MAG: hypothetical protein RLZZ297_506 [Chloroflexota bacterium]
MRIVIVANAPVPADPALSRCIAAADAVIAADGGGIVLAEQGLTPDLLIGDLDSISSDALAFFAQQQTEIRRFPRAKDETDLELALIAAVERGATHIDVFCVLGGRWDHTFATIALLTLPLLAELTTIIYADGQTLQVVRSSAVVHGHIGDVVSLLPLTPAVHGITTDGLAYPLADAPLYYEHSRGVSNELVSPTAHVSIREGLLLLIHDGRRA